MKLQLVPAKAGAAWVKQGVRTFFRQPMAMTGLFFLFMTMMSLSSLIPFLGVMIALALLPAATLGLMAATKEASAGKFPMPTILLSAFRAGRQRLRAMLVLGALYAGGFLLVMGISALFDGGQFASLYLVGGPITEEMVKRSDFQWATWVALALYLPLSLTFWHAPALVHWHGVPPLQSMFYSLVACARNFWAFTVYGLVWLGLFLGSGVVLSLLSLLIGSPQSLIVFMWPVALVLAAMFFSSLYFTFEDCFDAVAPGSLLSEQA